MKLQRAFGVVCVTGLLAGCSWVNHVSKRHNNDYLAQSNEIAPLTLPAGKSRDQLKAFYPTPSNRPAEKTPPSLLPPGSHIAHPTSNSQTSLVKQPDGAEALFIKSNPEVAFKDVGNALTDSGYRVLDQDQSLGAYFVLDAQQTNGRITKATPIVRVNVISDGTGSEVTLASHGGEHLTPQINDRVLRTIQQHLG